MFNIKSIISILLIIQLILINCNSVFSQSETLYAVTVNENNEQTSLLIVVENKILVNKGITLPQGFLVKGISNIDYSSQIISLFCQDVYNEKSYIANYNIVSGEVEISFAINSGLYGYIKEGLNNFLYKPNENVYLTIDTNQGIKLINWDFNTTEYSSVGVYDIDYSQDIDTTQPSYSTFDFNGNLIIAYQSKLDQDFEITLLYIDLNQTLPGENELIPFKSFKIDTYYFLFDSDISQIYTDKYGGVYLISDDQSACKIDFTQLSCVYSSWEYPVNINPNNYNYNPIVVSQDKSNIITLISEYNSQNNNYQLIADIFNSDWSNGLNITFTNYWTSSVGTTYTYFAI